MENWENLNVVLSLERKESDRKEAFSKALIESCLKGEKEAIKKILKAGAHLNCHDEHMTPLISCIQNDNVDLLYYLLLSGASISYRPKIGFQDAFWYALSNKKYDFLKIFIEHRCVLQRESEKNLTALIYATIGSDLIAVEMLLSHYAIRVNERDGVGNTALHYNMAKDPMTSDDIEIGKLLIAAGAETSTRNLDGQTPEDLAKDFAAKALLLHDKVEKAVPEKEFEPVVEPQENVILTKEKRLKI